MEIGASTACFYPIETEKALKKVCDLGFKTTEVFVNSPCELEDNFVKELKLLYIDVEEYNLFEYYFSVSDISFEVKKIKHI